MEIRGSTVLVTGASRGIGAAIALSMARAGAARVLLLARDAAALEAVAAQVRACGSEACCYPVDLASAEAVDALAQRILADSGAPDILVNNAGSGQWKFLEDTSAQEIQAMMTLPYFAAAWLTRHFLPHMRRRGRGHIVNISSVASRFVWPGATAYCAARWAMRGLSEALRADLYGSGIGVTLFESGEVRSTYWSHNPGSHERIPRIGRLVPPLEPHQVGDAMVAAVRDNRKHVVIPFMMRLVCLQHALFPGLVQWLMTVTGYRRR